MDPIYHINQEQLRIDLPSFRVGDTVAVKATRSASRSSRAW